MPPKLWHGAHEPPPETMQEHEKRANEALAKWLRADWAKGKRPRTLDIGAAYPILSHALSELGCNAYSMDGEPHVFEGYGGTMTRGDFESAEVAGMIRIGDESPPFSLITAIHTFEHFYDPVAALRKMRQIIKPDGHVFLRLPDHGVPGFERDLGPGHYSIHPFYHCFESLLQIIVELGDAFEVAWTAPVPPGQRDIVLRPITKRPTLGLAMIVKNEARDLPRCLDSIVPIIDAAAIADTGSTDNTRDIAYKKLAAIDFEVFDYTGASERNAAGNWELWDFSKARNKALATVEQFAPDWITWMDGDDELLTPSAYQRALYRGDVDTFGIKIESGGHAWVHQRLWRGAKKVRFAGRCHEYPILEGLRAEMLLATVRHHLDPDASQENSNVRNLRILMREWGEKETERTAFYIANTHKDGDRHAEAVEWYRKRLAFGPDKFRDEWLFAWLYMARSIRRLGNDPLADAELAAAEVVAPDWCEFTAERAAIAYDAKDFRQAIAHASRGIDKPITPSPLWREPHAYRDGPCRLISWCLEHLGEIDRAALWAIHAAERIGKPDAEWEARTRKLKARTLANMMPRDPVEAPAILTHKQEQIALVRPGAIGDVLMTLNLIPALKEAHPDAFVSYYVHPSIGAPDALGPYMLRAGVNVIMDVAHVDAWKGDKQIRLVGYPLAEGYPDKPMRRHLLEYFAEEMGLAHSRAMWIDDELPALTLRRPPRPPGSRFRHIDPRTGAYATIQTVAGWSKYKEWSFERWVEVVRALQKRFTIPFLHIAALGHPRFPEDVDVVSTAGAPLSTAVAGVANARMHIGIDSFANHLTNYFWQDDRGGRRVPGVILWGSTQMEAAGYPTNTNIGHRLACGPCFRENPAISRMPRGLCIDPPGQTAHSQHVHACMASITVDEVVAAASALWEAAK